MLKVLLMMDKSGDLCGIFKYAFSYSSLVILVIFLILSWGGMGWGGWPM